MASSAPADRHRFAGRPFLRFAGRRILHAIPVLFGLVTLVFFLSRLLPGDAASIYLSPTISPAVLDRLREQFGLDRPLAEQYLRWLVRLAHGDLGYSFTHNTPVLDVLLAVFPNTLLLGLSAFILEAVFAFSLTALAIRRVGSPLDRVLSHSFLVVYALPTFWIGVLLVTLFSYALGWFPSSHMFSPDTGISTGFTKGMNLLQHLVLPAVTIAIPGAAGLARYLRSSVDDVLRQEYVRTAQSMGLRRNRMIRRVVLPNAAGPVLSLLGIEIGVLLSGVVVTETLFAWPGMGRLTVLAILARDYPLLLGCTIVAGCAVIAGNLLGDMFHAIIDPRVRAE